MVADVLFSKARNPQETSQLSPPHSACHSSYVVTKRGVTRHIHKLSRENSSIELLSFFPILPPALFSRRPTMDKFAELFSKLQTPETMANMRSQATRSFLQDLSTQSQYIKTLPPDPKSAKRVPNWDGFSVLDPSFLQKVMASDATKTRYPAPKTLLCANVQPAKYSVCLNPGKMACSACKLVSYCSKVSMPCVVACVLSYFAQTYL